MTGKIGFTLYDGEIVGLKGSARLDLQFISRSYTSESGAYSPAECVNVTCYNYQELKEFISRLSRMAEELQEKKGEPG